MRVLIVLLFFSKLFCQTIVDIAASEIMSFCYTNDKFFCVTYDYQLYLVENLKVTRILNLHNYFTNRHDVDGLFLPITIQLSKDGIILGHHNDFFIEFDFNLNHMKNIKQRFEFGTFRVYNNFIHFVKTISEKKQYTVFYIPNGKIEFEATIPLSKEYFLVEGFTLQGFYYAVLSLFPFEKQYSFKIAPNGQLFPLDEKIESILINTSNFKFMSVNTDLLFLKQQNDEMYLFCFWENKDITIVQKIPESTTDLFPHNLKKIFITAESSKIVRLKGL